MEFIFFGSVLGQVPGGAPFSQRSELATVQIGCKLRIRDRKDELKKQARRKLFFLVLCCLGKIPGGAPFSQLHKSGNGSRVDRP